MVVKWSFAILVVLLASLSNLLLTEGVTRPRTHTSARLLSPNNICNCVQIEDCADYDFQLMNSSKSDICPPDQICCKKLRAEQGFNDVDYNKPLESSMPSLEPSTQFKPVRSPAIDGLGFPPNRIFPGKSSVESKPNNQDRGRQPVYTRIPLPLLMSSPPIPTALSPFARRTVISASEFEEDESEEEIDAHKKYLCGVPTPHLNLGVKGSPDYSEENTQSAFFGEFPWTLMIRIDEEQVRGVHCGAVLVKENIAITAAHCVVGIAIEKITVRAGEFDLLDDDEDQPHQDRKVSHIIKHPHYDEETLLFDIAIVILSSPFKLGPHIRTLCIPVRTENISVPCIATGWGSRGPSVNPKEQRKMKKVHLSLMKRKECQQIFRSTKQANLGPDFVLSSKFICAIGEEDDVDTCLGDGGGPLFCKVEGENRYTLVGITSWGKCNIPNLPGAYTNVMKARDWIIDYLIGSTE